MASKVPKGIKKEDWIFVRAAIGDFVFRCEDSTLGYHNFLGNNKHGLMRVFGCAPMMYAAVMLTAGVFKFWGKDDRRKVIVKDEEWKSIMISKEITSSGQFSTYGDSKVPIVSIGTINPRVADSSASVNRHRKDDLLTAKLQFGEPPIPPPRRTISKIRELFKETVSPHIIGGYELISFEMNSKVLEEGKAFAREIQSDEPCAHDDDDTVITNITNDDDDDSDDEDFDPAEDDDEECLLDTDLEREYMLHFESEEDEGGAAASEESNEFPLLEQYGIDPFDMSDENRNKRERLVGELWRANSQQQTRHGKKKKTNTMQFQYNKNGKKGRLFLIPQIDYGKDAVAANKQFQKKTKDTGAVHELILYIGKGKEENVSEAARSMCEVLWRSYKNEQYQAAKEKDQVLLKDRFDDVKTAALLGDMNINLGQLRILSRYLKDHFGYTVLAPEPNVYQLGLGYVEPEWGNYEYIQPNKLAEDCPYWIRNIKDVIMKVTERRFLGNIGRKRCRR